MRKLSSAAAIVSGLFVALACSQQPKANALPVAPSGAAGHGKFDPSRSSARPVDWGYEGDLAPEHWAELDPAYQACATGVMQSPVDIPVTRASEAAAYEMSYGNVRASIARHQNVDDIIDNGHTIQVTVEQGGQLQTAKDTYELKQFHFHTPSENKLDGRQYPLEVHLVHQSASGNFAVLAVFFAEGEENPVLERLLTHLPDKDGETREIEGKVDLSLHFDSNADALHFMGSFTTPPCTENVEWIVLSTPRKASRSQFERFAERLDHNNRPVQPWHDRLLSTDQMASEPGAASAE